MRKALLTVGACAVLLPLIGAVQRLQPDADRVYRPIAATGRIGQEVRTPPYTVRVDGVASGRELRVAGFLGKTSRQAAKGVWVVVGLTATATQEDVALGRVTLRAPDGRTFAATDRFTGLDTVTLRPGIPVSGQVAFELPAAAVKGAVLDISRPAYGDVFRPSGALGPAVEIELRLDGTAAPTVSMTEADT
ncbi:hypothetical protein [Nonomuraea longicatena]|uniref:DUF4352 domain-containing protein n=1 Tax=Nonomuraea longicatena TaxID=83682 RepID=A0ABN1NL91_9ACTN